MSWSDLVALAIVRWKWTLALAFVGLEIFFAGSDYLDFVNHRGHYSPENEARAAAQRANPPPSFLERWNANQRCRDDEALTYSHVNESALAILQDRDCPWSW